MRQFLLALLAVPIAASAVDAAPRCEPRDNIVRLLSEKHGEQLRALGLQQNGMMMELFGSETRGTWSIVLTAPNKISCIVAYGGNLEVLQAKPDGSDT